MHLRGSVSVNTCSGCALFIFVDYIWAESVSREKPVIMHPLLLQGMNQDYLCFLIFPLNLTRKPSEMSSKLLCLSEDINKISKGFS